MGSFTCGFSGQAGRCLVGDAQSSKGGRGGIASYRRELAGEALRCPDAARLPASRSSSLATQAAYVAKLKLPATHMEASEKALDQLKASQGVNREWSPHLTRLHIPPFLLASGPCTRVYRSLSRFS